MLHLVSYNSRQLSVTIYFTEGISEKQFSCLFMLRFWFRGVIKVDGTITAQ